MAETPQRASSFDGLLAESRDMACQRLAAAMARMLDKADESLSALISETQSQDAQALYQDTRKVLASQRQKLEREFQKFYVNEFRNRTILVKDPGHTFSELQRSTLQLVGEDDLEETLKFKEMATKLRRYCDEELSALDQRVGVLLGDANLADEVNPLSPQAICDAFQQACHELGTTMKVRGVLLKLFDDHVIDDVRSIYKAVNALLVKNGILPKIRYGVSRKADGKPAPGAARASADEAEAAPAPAAEGAAGANIFSMLQSLVASGAGGAGVAAGPAPGQPVLQGAELLGSLTRIQHGEPGAAAAGLPAGGVDLTNMLRDLKTSSVGAGMGQMDAMTLDIVAMLFDQLFDDPKIPIGLKGLIGRMQIPMLKVAIADKSFFSRKNHPARQMLDRFGEIALRLPPDFNAASPLFPKLEAIVQAILDGFEEDLGIFEAAEEQLRGVIAEDDQRIESETRAVAESAAQAETLAVAKTAAEDEIRARVQTRSLPGPVLEFLIEHWLKLLLLVHVKFGTAGAQWKGSLDVMDELVWSVDPQKTIEERRKLAAAVPRLVKNLSNGLQALGVDEQVRNAFFSELMKYHTDILSAGAKGKPEAGAAAKPAAKKPASALDFTETVTVRNPYGAGEVKVAGLDVSGGSPEAIEMGDWVEFRPPDGEAARAAKVLFVSPKKTRYIFSDRNGKDILELKRAELARRMRSGEALKLAEEPEQPLFDRIMNSLVDKLRAPAKQAA